jgi:hypothetical protein
MFCDGRRKEAVGRAPRCRSGRDSCRAKKRGLCCENTTGPFPLSGHNQESIAKDVGKQALLSPSIESDPGHNRESLNPSADPCGNAKCATSVLQACYEVDPDLQTFIELATRRWSAPEVRARLWRAIQE